MFANYKKHSPAGASTTTINTDDLMFIMDKCVVLANDNYVLRLRVALLENIVKWCLQFIMFISSIGTLIFQENMPITAIIFNTDLLDIPHKLVNDVYAYAERIQEYMLQTYNKHRLLGISIEQDVLNQQPPVPDFNNLKSYMDNLNTNYDTFAREFSKNDTDFRFVSPFRQQKLDGPEILEDIKQVLNKHNIDFSPQYVLKMHIVSEMLIYFLTRIYTYVPHLKVDFKTEDHLQYSLERYLTKLKEFWDASTNLCIGGMHVHYDTNNFETSQTVQAMFKNVFDNKAEDFFDAQTQLMLSQKRERNFTLKFADPTNQLVADSWRLQLTRNITHMTDAQRQDLFETYLRDMTAQNVNVFSKKVLSRLHLQQIEPGDYLTHLKYTVFEQCCLLKLIIRQLLLRLYNEKCDTSIGDPLNKLIEHIWPGQKVHNFRMLMANESNKP